MYKYSKCTSGQRLNGRFPLEKLDKDVFIKIFEMLSHRDHVNIIINFPLAKDLVSEYVKTTNKLEYAFETHLLTDDGWFYNLSKSWCCEMVNSVE